MTVIAAAVAEHGRRQQVVVLPDQRMHIGEVLVAGCRGAGEPPAAGRQIPRLFDPSRHSMSRRRRLWRGFGNGVGLWRIGFRRRERRRRHRRHLLRLLGRLRLGGWSFGPWPVFRPPAGRPSACRPLWLRVRRDPPTPGGRAAAAEWVWAAVAAAPASPLAAARIRAGRDRLGLGGRRNRPIDQQQQRQQMQYQRADRPAQPAPPARSFSLLFSFEGFG